MAPAVGKADELTVDEEAMLVELLDFVEEELAELELCMTLEEAEVVVVSGFQVVVGSGFQVEVGGGGIHSLIIVGGGGGGGGGGGAGGPPSLNCHSPYMIPADSGAKNRKRPRDKSRPPKGHPGH